MIRSGQKIKIIRKKEKKKSNRWNEAEASDLQKFYNWTPTIVFSG